MNAQKMEQALRDIAQRLTDVKLHSHNSCHDALLDARRVANTTLKEIDDGRKSKP